MSKKQNANYNPEVMRRLREIVNEETLREEGAILVNLEKEFPNAKGSRLSCTVSLFVQACRWSAVRMNDRAESVKHVTSIKKVGPMMKLLEYDNDRTLCKLYVSAEPNGVAMAGKVYLALRKHLASGMRHLDKTEFRSGKLADGVRGMLDTVNEAAKDIGVRPMELDEKEEKAKSAAMAR